MQETDGIAKIIYVYVVALLAMMNELLKIQQDMSAPRQADVHDADEVDQFADPNDWVAEIPKFGIYHRGYTTSHWLQVFRPL